MTEPHRWPNNAAAARDTAAEEAQKGIHALEPVLGDCPMNDKEMVRRVAVALISLQKVARILESVGAPTRAF